ncbi:LysE family translocator [Thalassobaculum sp.]|uniref:LysE family translocator n=1 Tax=Thalassobaculum sp. TaxID=2022740 RepID=UPI0032EF2299
MTLETWIAFAALETVLCLIPGPAVLFVLGQGLVQGPRSAVAASVGILSANAGYFAVSATGLGALLLASYEVFFAIKWLGVAYLVWLGLRALLARPEALAVERSKPASVWRVLRRGFLVQAANPKTILFFGALLPQFIDPTGDVVAQMLILGVTSVVVEFVVLAVYGGLAGRLRQVATRPAVALWFERVAGGLLITAGLGMAAIRRAD